MLQETFENVSCFGCGAEIGLSSVYTLMADLSGCTALYADASPQYSFELRIKRKMSNCPNCSECPNCPDCPNQNDPAYTHGMAPWRPHGFQIPTTFQVALYG